MTLWDFIRKREKEQMDKPVEMTLTLTNFLSETIKNICAKYNVSTDDFIVECIKDALEQLDHPKPTNEEIHNAIDVASKPKTNKKKKKQQYLAKQRADYQLNKKTKVRAAHKLTPPKTPRHDELCWACGTNPLTEEKWKEYLAEYRIANMMRAKTNLPKDFTTHDRGLPDSIQVDDKAGVFKNE
jgi:hypothetical protein